MEVINPLKSMKARDEKHKSHYSGDCIGKKKYKGDDFYEKENYSITYGSNICHRFSRQRTGNGYTQG